MSQETFVKAQSYGRDKARFALWQALYNQLITYGMVQYGFYPLTWSWTGEVLQKAGLAESRVVGDPSFPQPPLLRVVMNIFADNDLGCVCRSSAR